MANELASLDDVQTHLPEDKLEVDESSVDLLQIDVRRIIKGYLSGVFSPTTLAGWDAPDHTPETIRAIAGRLIAAAYYSNRYAEDVAGAAEYAQNLYNEGMRMLGDVQTGRTILEGVAEVTKERLTSSDFWPNDSTGDPMFKVEDIFA